VIAAWFGIIGVLVGGLVSTITALFSEVRKELNDAVVAARIIDSDLRTEPGSSAGDEHQGELWATHRVALARTLGYTQWRAVAAVYETKDLTGPKRAKATSEAREMLGPVVSGKRFFITQRFGNFPRRNPRR
jgi:hypothetical protein